MPYFHLTPSSLLLGKWVPNSPGFWPLRAGSIAGSCILYWTEAKGQAHASMPLPCLQNAAPSCLYFPQVAWVQGDLSLHFILHFKVVTQTETVDKAEAKLWGVSACRLWKQSIPHCRSEVLPLLLPRERFQGHWSCPKSENFSSFEECCNSVFWLEMKCCAWNTQGLFWKLLNHAWPFFLTLSTFRCGPRDLLVPLQVSGKLEQIPQGQQKGCKQPLQSRGNVFPSGKIHLSPGTGLQLIILGGKKNLC